MPIPANMVGKFGIKTPNHATFFRLAAMFQFLGHFDPRLVVGYRHDSPGLLLLVFKLLQKVGARVIKRLHQLRVRINHMFVVES